MSEQLKLFDSENHLTPDYFISGNPEIPDPQNEQYYTYEGIIMRSLEPPLKRTLELCDRVEDGWRWKERR